MRAIAVLFLMLLTSGAGAQVSVDMKALDQLGPAPPVARPPPPVRRPPIVAANRPASGKPSAAPVTRPASGGATPAPAATPPPAVASVPTPALPLAQPAEPPPITMVPAPTPGPLPPPVRLVFEEGKTALTPADEAAIQSLAKSIPAPAADSVNVLAYAAGKPDDPSTARRLSLSRGLAVRSVLLASGIPSAQIYVRALGATASEGPADRVELSVAPIGTVTR